MHSTPSAELRRRVDVTVLMLISLALFVPGVLLTLIHSEIAIYGMQSFSITDLVIAQWSYGQVRFALLTAFFLIVLPLGQLIVIAWMWYGPGTADGQVMAIGVLMLMTRPSVIELLIVLVVMFGVHLGVAMDLDARAGFDLYACGAIGSCAVARLALHAVKNAL